jgi:hypothetical protein
LDWSILKETGRNLVLQFWVWYVPYAAPPKFRVQHYKVLVMLLGFEEWHYAPPLAQAF